MGRYSLTIMLVPIDGRSLLLAKSIMVLSSGIGIALSSVHLRQFRSLRLWAVSLVMLGVAAVTQAQRGMISPWLAIVGSNLTIMVAISMFPVAMARDCQQQPNLRLVLSILLGAMIAFLAGWFVWPSMEIRIVAVRCCMGSMMLLAAWTHWRELRQNRFNGIVLYTFLPLVMLGLTHWVAIVDIIRNDMAGGVSQQVLLTENIDQTIHMQLGSLLWWLVSSTAFLFGLLLRVTVRLNEEVQRQAEVDHLTGTYTRRAFMTRAEHQLQHSHKNSEPLALLFLDLDHFKQLNDRHGHQAGDAALAHFTEVLHGVARKTDLIGRYGGEEFCLLLVGADPELADQIAQRICNALRSHPFHFDGKTIPMTVSVGIAPRMTPAEPFGSMISRADSALYEAKRNGRDQVAQSA